MECEICGSESAEYVVLVEGAKLNVCKECSGTGKILKAPPARVAGGGTGSRQKTEIEIVDGYGSLIMQARKKLGLPLEVLAERINEKHSFLERIEREKTLPDEKLARKLERELGIKLVQEVGSESSLSANKGGQGGGGITLGDILEIETKRKGK